MTIFSANYPVTFPIGDNLVGSMFGDLAFGSPDLVFDTPEKRAAAANLPVWKRQLIIKHLRVPYHTYNRGLSMIARFHMPVDGGLPNLGVAGGMLGESGCGKTVICETYASMHPPFDGETGVEMPVVLMSASVGISRRRIGDRIRRTTDASYRILTREDPGDWSVDRLLKLKTQLFILDESQFLFFDQRTSHVAQEMYGLVKDIADTGMISIFLVGHPSIDEFVCGIDAFRRREYRSETLKPLSSSPEDLALFGDLLTSIDRRLPFRESSQLQKYRDHFHLYSGGQIGFVMNVVRSAAYLALNDRAACILVHHLREAVSTMVKPSDDTNYFGYKKAQRS
ncbi:AAA family ATPase [Rhizobium sp. NLR12b]|uniref:TniB family NTP-binding protein n=1 Tax=Rhizobium sp. NLR12b TaxID=2731108 RepID=UPI001C82AB83|nr:TniB family NTP-binding protein [Rhizobium sp. NLR12b]MBX5303178.1 AAA family ATPase [Rhizobium sp. NLR12b]